MTTKKAPRQKKMKMNAADEPQRNQSQYDLFRGKFTFVDEPYWLRLVLTILSLSALLALIFILSHQASPVLGLRCLRQLPGIKNLLEWMNRSP